MSSDPQPDWENWRERDHPWEASEGSLPDDKVAEVLLYIKQDRLKIEREQRRANFEEEIRQKREAFDEAEERGHEDLVYPMAHRLWYQSIEDVRAKMVPAYTFIKFCLLPLEIQLRIWSLAARTEEPRIYSFLEIEDHSPDPHAPEHALKGSSRILRRPHNRKQNPESFPLILHVCRNSRAVAQSIFTILPSKKDAWAPDTTHYYNVLYNSFYIGPYGWDACKILIDILIRRNTTRPLIKAVQRDMGQLLNIRHLMVDFHIFRAVPASIWADFEKLATLKIMFYPFPVTTDPEEPFNLPRFVKPQRGTKYGKRADWIYKSAWESLVAAKRDEIPEWRLPEIEVAVWTTGDEDSEHYVEEEWTEEEVEDDEDEDDSDDDSTWYQEAATKMTHTVPKETIRVLKREHHPSRKRGLNFGFNLDLESLETGNGSTFGTYVTDSEAEVEERDALWTHDEW